MIELLVVISIIVLLVAILLPALSAARTTARTAVCLSNIRQLGVTFQNYAMENGGYFPRRHWNDIQPSGGGYAWTAELWARGYVKDVRAYSCPEMEHLGGRDNFVNRRNWLVGRTVDSVISENFWTQSHYGYNIRNIGSNFRNDDENPNVDSGDRWKGPTARPEDVHAPSDTVLLADSVNQLRFYTQNRLYGAYDLVDIFNTGSHNGGLHARHAEAVTIQWVDGHATNVKANPANPYETLGEYSVTQRNIWSR